MLQLIRRHYRRAIFTVYRYFRHPARMKRSRLLRWFSRHYLDRAAWKPTQHSFAGGLALGMFISSIIFPGQMPVAVIMAGLLRVNVPVAVVACWWSNPFTFGPMIVAEVTIGEWFLRLIGRASDGGLAIQRAKQFLSDSAAGEMGWGEVWPRFAELLGAANELYIGAVVAGVVLAAASYALAFALWGWFTRSDDDLSLTRQLPGSLGEGPPGEEMASPGPGAVDLGERARRRKKRRRKRY